MDFSEKLKYLRLENGYSQTALAKELYVTRQAISKWERGVGRPDHTALEQISSFFDVSIDQLLKQDIDLSSLPAAPEIHTVIKAEEPEIESSDFTESQTRNGIEKRKFWDFIPQPFKDNGFHLIAMAFIAFFPMIIHPLFLCLSFPIMLLAIRYQKRKLFYTVTLVVSLLFVSFEFYGHLSMKYGWFTDVEVIPLESDTGNDFDSADMKVIEELEK